VEGARFVPKLRLDGEMTTVASCGGGGGGVVVVVVVDEDVLDPQPVSTAKDISRRVIGQKR
jgi:hypothetical protein